MARNIDWESIERDYRAGLRTLREIADEHGVSHQAINKRAKRDGWDRDLQVRIAAKAEALVAKREVAKEVAKARLATERQTIEANAQMLADTILLQREDVQRARRVEEGIWADLEAAGDESVGERSRIYKTLMDATRSRIELERRILRLDDAAQTAQLQVSVVERRIVDAAEY